jgi:hypothetical protein
VAYQLLFNPGVRDYLRNHAGLSRTGRVRLFTNIDGDLRERADFYRSQPVRRLSPGSDCFWYDIVLKDNDGDGLIHRFWFVVSDAPAAYGVLRVEYVEEGGPTNWPPGG